MPDVLFDTPRPGVALITPNRPDSLNAEGTTAFVQKRQPQFTGE